MSKTFSKDDVASHSKGDSLWIIVDEDVYDVTKFQDEHPGKFSWIELYKKVVQLAPFGVASLPITCANGHREQAERRVRDYRPNSPKRE